MFIAVVVVRMSSLLKFYGASGMYLKEIIAPLPRIDSIESPISLVAMTFAKTD